MIIQLTSLKEFYQRVRDEGLKYHELPTSYGIASCYYCEGDLVALGFLPEGRSHEARLLFPHKEFHSIEAFIRPEQDENLNPHTAPLLLWGTSFQQRVWQALMEIPFGETRSYKQVAQAINQPQAARAVGQAIGANPISWLVPCHRVLYSDSNRPFKGYRWGPDIKHKLLAGEK